MVLQITYSNPVGLTAAQRDCGVFPPPDWDDATGIRIYDGPGGKAWHTGADLNCNRPVWNADAKTPVYAIQDGIVIDAREWLVWGFIIIVDHGIGPDNLPVIARYAHVEQMIVMKGQRVRKGQQIALIGNGYQGSQPYHLHFDLGFTDVLKLRPNDWPGMDEKRLRDNYRDPGVFMRKYSNADAPVTLKVHGGTLNRRASATTLAATVGTPLAAGKLVSVFPRLFKDKDSNFNFVALADGSGYVAREYLIEPVEERVIVERYVDAEGGLNVRATPSTTGRILRAVAHRTLIRVDATLIDDPASEHAFRQLADESGYVADTHLSIDPPPIIITPVPTPTPPAPAPSWTPDIKAEMIGVHADAGGWRPSAKELNIVQRNKVKWALLVAYEAGVAAGVISDFRSVGVQHFVIRAATHDEYGNVPDAATFIARTLPNLREYAAAIGDNKKLLIAVHNEPNATLEGAGFRWKNGTEFALWYLKVASAYRKEFPGCKIGFPALSPGGAIPNVRLDEKQFIQEAIAAGAIRDADWIGVHYYWTRGDGKDIDPPITRWRGWFGSKPLIGTEVGPANNAPSTAEAFREGYRVFGRIGVPLAGWVLNNRGRKEWQDWLTVDMTLWAVETH